MVDPFTGEGIEPSPDVVEITQTRDPKEFLPWVEKYRPATIDEMIMPDNIRKMVETAISINSVGNYVLYSGRAGTGKTTLAQALPTTLGTTFRMYSTRKSGDFFDDIDEFASQEIIDGMPRFVVIDEADHPRNPAEFYRELQTRIETMSSTLRFILTCNEFYRLPEPITSRCFPISFDFDLTQEDLKRSMGKRLLHIARQETAPYNGNVNKNTIVDIVNKCYPDMRAMINTMFNNFLENKCSVDGTVTKYAIESHKELIDLIMTGNDLVVRNYVRENYVDFDGFFHTFAEEMIMLLPPEARLQFNIYTAQYADMANKQVNPYVVIDGYTSCIILLLKKIGKIQ